MGPLPNAESLGRHLVISFGWNYGPLGIEAKRLMDEEGGVGEVEHVMVSMASGTRELLTSTGGGGYEGSAEGFAPEAATWTDPALSGGGYAPAQISHAMGLAMWLTDDRAQEVFAFMNNRGAELISTTPSRCAMPRGRPDRSAAPAAPDPPTPSTIPTNRGPDINSRSTLRLRRAAHRRLGERFSLAVPQ